MQPNSSMVISSVVIIHNIFQDLTDILLWKGPAPFPHRSVHENCGHKGRQPVENEAFVTSILIQPFLKTNGYAQIFCINTFQNDYSQTRNMWIELLDADVVMNGSVLAAGEKLWPDKSFIQVLGYISYLGNMVWRGLLQACSKSSNMHGACCMELLLSTSWDKAIRYICNGLYSSDVFRLNGFVSWCDIECQKK